MTDIDRIVYIEDSDDEFFLTRLMFESGHVGPELVHYARFDAFERDLLGGALGAVEATLVVIDLNLKIMKGTDALRRLRASPLARELVIGVCTGSEDPADRREVEAAGGEFFVGKPLDVSCLERICTLVPRLELVRAADGTVGLERTDVGSGS